MTRVFAISRPAFAAGVMFILAGVVVLSTATRIPCVRIASPSWHTCKAGRFTESEQLESAVTKVDASAEDVGAEFETAPPTYIPRDETLPCALALIVQKHHFRSPPSL